MKQHNDYLTVLTTKNGEAGNKVAAIKNKKLDVQMAKNNGEYFAITRHVPDTDTMLEVLHEVAGDESKLLIMGYAPGTESGDKYLIIPASGLSKHGTNTESKTIQWVAVIIDANEGDPYNIQTTARKKAWFRPSSWTQIDRDFTNGITEKLATLDEAQYLEAMGKVIPGLDGAAVICSASTSGRVALDGEPKASRGCHYWFQVDDAEKPLESTLLLARAVNQGYSFQRTWGEHQRLWAIFDPTVYSHERLVFEGKPYSEDSRITIGAPSINLIRAGGRVDTHLIPELKIRDKESFKQTTGMDYRRTGGGSVIVDEQSLHLDTRIETKDNSITIREYLESDKDKIRCQATFRPSDSWNGILNKDSQGRPFVFDNGMRVRYALIADEFSTFITEQLREILDSNPVLINKKENIEKLKFLKANDPVRWTEIRSEIKANKNTGGIKDIDEAVGPAQQQLTGGGPKYNPQLADATLAEIGADQILSHAGDFWVWESGYWCRIDHDDRVRKEVQNVLDHSIDDRRWTASQVSDVATIMRSDCHRDVEWDRGNKESINVSNGELHLINEYWQLLPHRKDNYYTSMLPVVYDPEAVCPNFDEYLKDVFLGDEDAGEKQLLALQIIGYSLLRTTRLEKFFFLLGDGGSGKTTMIEALKAVAGVGNIAGCTLKNLSDRHYKANLVGKLVNITSEMSAGDVLPDGCVKDLATGERWSADRKYGHVFEFQPFATLILVGNELPTCRDTTYGMRRKGEVLNFNRSFAGPDQAPDTNLREKLSKEGSGILNRVLPVLVDLLKDGFVKCPSSHAGMDAWMESNDSALGFWKTRCIDEVDSKTPLASMYSEYKDWCTDNGRYALSNPKFAKRLRQAGVKIESSTGNIVMVFGARLASVADLEFLGKLMKDR